MNEWLNRIFDTTTYETAGQRAQANLIYGVNTFTLVSILVAIVLLPTEQDGVPLLLAMARGYDFDPSQLAIFAMLFITPLIYYLVRRGDLGIAKLVFYPTIVSGLGYATVNGFNLGYDLVMATILIIIAALLFEGRDYLIAASLPILMFVVSLFIAPPPFNFGLQLLVIVIFFVTVGLGYLYNVFGRIQRAEGIQTADAERLKLAEITRQITEQATLRVPLQDVLDHTIDTLLENYPQMYHAQVFLIDEDGVLARLQASTGAVGQELLERDHGLAVGSMSVIGQTTLGGEPIIEQAGDPNGIHRPNPLLPNTTLEAAFPMVVEDKIVGALDLQSSTVTRLSATDRLSFQSIANSLALAVDSIRQFTAAQSRIQENLRLAEQTRTALREVERLNQRLIGRAWSEYLRGYDGEVGFNIDLEANQTVSAATWTTTLSDAAQSGELIHKGNIVAVPLRVRGQVVGAMEFELDDDNRLSDEELELIAEISSRFGLAAENTRLLEDSQRIAQRETLINEISSRLQASNNVEATLAEAARSLRETLNAERVSIRLGSPEETSRNGTRS